MSDDDVLPNSDDDLDEIAETPSSGRDQEKKKKRLRGNDRPDDEDEDEDEDQGEDDDDDDDDDDDALGRGRAQKKPRQHTGKKLAASFFDEAAIDSDSDNTESEPEEDDGDFSDIVATGSEEESISISEYRGLRRQDSDEDEVAQMAKGYEKRVERSYSDEDQTISQELLLPNAKDPKLFLVECGRGKERDVVIAVTHKWRNTQSRGDERVKITGAMARPGLFGFVYIEAYHPSAVEQALKNVPNVDTRKIRLVPLDEMQDCVKPYTKKHLQKGEFVRIKRGLYRDDVAQVMSFDQSSNKAELKLLPRLDYERMKVERATREIERARRHDLKGSYVAPPKMKAGPRAARRKFSRVDAEHALGRDEVMETNDGKMKIRSKGDVYTASGFLLKKFPVTSLQTDVSPGPDDVLLFSQDDDESNRVVPIKRAKKIIFAHGDAVELVQGDLKGLRGTVARIVDDNIFLKVKDFDELLEVDSSHLIKSFLMGDHVKVVAGHFEGETGLILRIANQVAYILTDVTRQEISVLCQDLHKADEVAVSRSRLNGYDLNDLVQLTPVIAGMIIKINRDSFQILDCNGQVRSNVPSTDMGRRLLNRDTSTFDRNSSSVRIGDSIKVVEGAHNGKAGTVLQIWKSSVFIRCGTAIETCGIIVARGSSCTVAGSSFKPDFPALPSDLSLSGRGRGASMNPFGMVGRGGFGRGGGGPGGASGRLGKTGRITAGPWKGYVGRVKDESGTALRIELQANCKVVTVCPDQFKEGERQPTPASYSSILPPQTPSHAAPNTPMHTTGFETPSRTPDTTWYSNDDDHYSTSTVQTPGLNTNQSWSDTSRAWSSSGGYLSSYGSSTTPYSTYSSPAMLVPATPHFGGVMTPSVPATPHFGGVMTPAFPSTPGLLPTTPAAGLTGYAPLTTQPAHWVQEDIIVRINSGEAKGRQGFVRSVDASGNIQVFVDSLGKNVLLLSEDISPAAAVRGNKVFLLGGADRGLTGTLDSVDTLQGGVQQGAVKLHTVNRITVVPLNELAPMRSS